MPYVESPLDRIVGVNFGGGLTQFDLEWSAALTPIPDAGPPFWLTGTFVMTVSVDGLPTLSRTTLTVQGGVRADQVIGDFPDGTGGVMHVEYYMDNNPSGFISYITTAQGGYRFGGANSLGISLAIELDGTFRAENIVWAAIAHLLDPSDNRPSTVNGTLPPTGGTLRLDATATLDPPSISLTGG